MTSLRQEWTSKRCQKDIRWDGREEEQICLKQNLANLNSEVVERAYTLVVWMGNLNKRHGQCQYIELNVS